MSDIVKRLRSPAYWISGSSEGHEGDNSAPIEAAARIEQLENETDAAHAVGFREGAAHMHKVQAARIEQLEAALREIEGHKYAEYGIRRIARAALGDHFVGVNKMVQAQEIDRLRAALREIGELPGELNLSNYTHDDVCILNDAYIKAWDIARAALGGE